MNNIHLWRWACTAYIAYFTQTAQTVKGAWESCSLKYGCMRNALFELQLHKKCAVWSTTTWDNGNELTGMRHKDALASNKYYYWQTKLFLTTTKNYSWQKRALLCVGSLCAVYFTIVQLVRMHYFRTLQQGLLVIFFQSISMFLSKF